MSSLVAPREAFEDKVSFRIFEQEKRAIKIICDRYPLKYENESHFIRVAIVKLIREETGVDAL